ncbi:MAG: FkbM family methyltransferase [Taibaiella sp.]|jgi:FkbM family methyltransferase
MANSLLLQKINKVEILASASKLQRLLFNPYKYISSIFFRDFLYKKSKKEKLVKAQVFFGEIMNIALPASTDIYLTGGKSHDSEIRLAKFIIQTLNSGDHFLDIGAHYGYFTLLAAKLVGETGKISAFEPSVNSFHLLQQNCDSHSNISIYQQAVSNTQDSIHFYEFDNLHSEYNSADVKQFEQEDWFKQSPPKKISVSCTTIDQVTASGFCPKIIKIDVEGGEYNVVKGALRFIENNMPFIAMEYLEPGRHNIEHQKAVAFLKEHGYKTYIIESSGLLKDIEDIDSYLLKNKLESDNIVFRKNTFVN